MNNKSTKDTFNEYQREVTASMHNAAKDINIVFTDRDSLGKGLDFSLFDSIGNTSYYGYSSPENVCERVKDAHVLVVNKTPMNAETLKYADNLKLICVCATGTDNLDKEYLESRGISYRNVVDYSTDSVAQHTFTLLLSLIEGIEYYSKYTRDGKFINDSKYLHYEHVFSQIAGKTWGILGLGNIGRKVAKIAEAFGCNVIYASASGAPPQAGYHQVDLDTLLRESHILTIHAPLNQYTRNIISSHQFSIMRNDAIIINTGRGAIIDEEALVRAIKDGHIAGAGIDVFSVEPMTEASPYIELLKDPRLILTPHVAWASIEARKTVISTVASQIIDFFQMANIK